MNLSHYRKLNTIFFFEHDALRLSRIINKKCLSEVKVVSIGRCKDDCLFVRSIFLIDCLSANKSTTHTTAAAEKTPLKDYVVLLVRSSCACLLILWIVACCLPALTSSPRRPPSQASSLFAFAPGICGRSGVCVRPSRTSSQLL